MKELHLWPFPCRGDAQAAELIPQIVPRPGFAPGLDTLSTYCLCVGLARQRWIPSLGSHQDLQIQSLPACSLADSGIQN